MSWRLSWGKLSMKIYSFSTFSSGIKKQILVRNLLCNLISFASLDLLVFFFEDYKGVGTGCSCPYRRLILLHLLDLLVLLNIQFILTDNDKSIVKFLLTASHFSSPRSEDWIKISEMFLGKVPDEFKFVPKHKAHAY